MRWYKADLHIHSVLSPCGGLDMSPKAVMQAAAQKGVDLIAITDHNCMANCVAYAEVAKEYGLNYLYGIEVQTAEEIHIIALFDSWKDAEPFGDLIYQSLLPIDNNPDFFGDQVIIDKDENILGMEGRALINSSILSYEEVFEKVKEFNGFAFPAHVDAPTFSVIAQLGFMPEGGGVIAAGITAKANRENVIDRFPYLKNFALIRNSDAHYPVDIASGYTDFFLETPCLDEIIQACQHSNGRDFK